jgi:hypothetical protein
MNIESLGKAYRALGALEGWVESAVQAEIEGAPKALENLKVIESELQDAKDLFLRAQGLLGA